MSPIVGPAQHTPEWYAFRRFDPQRPIPVAIGASYAHAACFNPLEPYLEIREGIERTKTDNMRMGTRLEPVILDEYDEREGTTVTRNIPMMMHPLHNFISASLDARLPIEEIVPVDAKATNRRMRDKTGLDTSKYGQEGTDQVPEYILFQMQQQMLVTDAQRAEVAVLWDGLSLDIYSIDRNDSLIDEIVESQRELAERIVDGKPPEPNWENPRTRSLMHDMYGYSKGKSIVVPASCKEMWLEAQRLGDIEKKAKADKDVIITKLHGMGQDAELLEIEGTGIVLRRTEIKDSFVTEADVEKTRANVGKVKRKGHVRLAQAGKAK